MFVFASRFSKLQKERDKFENDLIIVSNAFLKAKDQLDKLEATNRNMTNHIKNFDIRAAESAEVKRLKAANAKLIERINYIENK